MSPLEVLLYLSQTILQAYSLKVLKRQAAWVSVITHPTLTDCCGSVK